MRTLIEDWISTQYGTPPSEADYRTEHFQRYAVANVQMDRMFCYARRWATGVGQTFSTFRMCKRSKTEKRRTGENDKYSPWACGLALKHEAYYGDFSAYVHLAGTCIAGLEGCKPSMKRLTTNAWVRVGISRCGKELRCTWASRLTD